MPPLAGGALVAGAILGEIVLAAAIVQPRLLPLLAVVLAAGVMAGVFRFPLATAVLALVLVASVIDPKQFSVGVGPLTLTGFELVLGAVLVVAVLQPRRAWWGSASGAYAALFLVLLAIACAAALTAGRADFSTIFNWARSFSVLVLFFVVVRLFPDLDARRRLLACAAAIGGATGAVSLLLAAGFTPPWLAGDQLSLFVDEGAGGGGLDRVRLPGVALAFGLFWYAVVRLLRTSGWQRIGWSLVLAGFVVNLALSFNRNMWAALVAGLAVLLVFGGAGVRRPFVGALAVLGAVVAGAGLLGAEVQQGSPLQPIIERGQTLLDPRLAQRDQSLQSRFSENGKALEAIEDNLLIGIGPGVRFGAFFDDDRGSGVFRRTPQLFLHNQYLYLLLIGGIPLLLAFVLYVLSAVRQALPRWRDPEVAALVVGIGSIMLSAVVMISFADPHMLITLALLTGAVVAAGRAQPDDDPAS